MKKQEKEAPIVNQAKELEKLKLIEAASELGDVQLELGSFGIEDEVEGAEFLDDVQNPKEFHKLYYAMRSLISANLPKGVKNEKLRRFVTEPRRVFLNQGKEIDPESGLRGSEEKMTYLESHLKIALQEVMQWVQSNGSALDLRERFHKLNVKYGYKEESDTDYTY